MFYNNTLGFAHEQGRPDRDQFIEIDFEAIAKIERDEGWPNGTWQNQFLMCNQTRFGRKYGCKTFNRYDYSSISHYPNVLRCGNSVHLYDKHDHRSNSLCDH